MDDWEAAPRFSKLFSLKLKETSQEFKKVAFNHYRIDSVSAGNYGNSQGCISPSILRTVHSAREKSLVKYLTNKSKKKDNYFTGYAQVVGSVSPTVQATVNVPTATHSPNGMIYPKRAEVSQPRSEKVRDLYPPKIAYFANLFSFAVPPADSIRPADDYFKHLGKTPRFYCANFQSNRCSSQTCTYHHLCEWCAASHPGNECPYRPATVPLRQKRN